MKMKWFFTGFLMLGFFVIGVSTTLNYLGSVSNTKTKTMNVDTIKQEQQEDPVVSENETELLNLKDELVVLLYGPIHEQTLSVAEAIKRASQEGKTIWLLIDSPGGSVTVGGQILTAIQSSGVEVNTVCLSLCASMAAIIHQYGTKRHMVDRSLLMFHEASGGVSGPIPQMLSRLKTMDRYVNKMIKYVAKRSGQDLEKFKAQLAPEVWLDAEDAKQKGFVDSIVNVYFDEANAVNSNAVSNRTNQGTLKHLLNIEN